MDFLWPPKLHFSRFIRHNSYSTLDGLQYTMALNSWLNPAIIQASGQQFSEIILSFIYLDTPTQCQLSLHSCSEYGLFQGLVMCN